MARIREVWVPNLELEMRNIRDIIEQYPYITMVLVPPSFHLVMSRLTPSPGHRIPWSCGSPDRNIQDIIRLPLPNNAV